MSASSVPESNSSALAGFLSWPGGSSLLYLASAASLLGGMALVLSEGAADEGALLGRLSMLGAVTLYAMSLAAVALVVMRWREGQADAVALTTLGTVFTLGMIAPLLVMTRDGPMLCLILGACQGSVVIAAVGWVARRLLGPVPPGLAILGALLMSIAALLPGSMAVVHDQHGTTSTLHQQVWMWGVVIEVALAAGVLTLAWRHAQGLADGALPAVRRWFFPWILAAVFLATLSLFLWLLAYAQVMVVEWHQMMALPLLAIAVVDRLLARGGVPVSLRGMVLALPPVVFGLGCMIRAVAPVEGGFSGPAWVLHAPLLLIIGGLAVAWLAWRERGLWFTILAPAWVLVGIATFPLPTGGCADLSLIGGACLILITGLALRFNQPWLAVMTALPLAIQIDGRLPTTEVLRGLHIHGLTQSALVIGIHLLIVHLVAGGRMPRLAVVAEAVLLTAVGASITWPKDSLLANGLVAGCLPLLVLAPVLLRDHRAWRYLWPALFPMVAAIAGMLVAIKGWAAVIAAFALLGIGVAHTWRRAARGAGQTSPLIPDVADPSE